MNWGLAVKASDDVEALRRRVAELETTPPCYCADYGGQWTNSDGNPHHPSCPRKALFDGTQRLAHSRLAVAEARIAALGGALRELHDSVLTAPGRLPSRIDAAIAHARRVLEETK
jgi:hypothetical protein